MANTIGSGKDRRLIDSDGDPIDNGSGRLKVAASIDPNTSVGQFALSVASGSATRLSSVSCTHVDIMANLSNTGIIYIGTSAVSATESMALYAGDVYSVDISNANLLYALATVDGEDINVVYYV